MKRPFESCGRGRVIDRGAKAISLLPQLLLSLKSKRLHGTDVDHRCDRGQFLEKMIFNICIDPHKIVEGSYSLQFVCVSVRLSVCWHYSSLGQTALSILTWFSFNSNVNGHIKFIYGERFTGLTCKSL